MTAGMISIYPDTAKSALERWSNVQQVKAYMPEPFGTHHTKAMVIFRSDETAQIVITTANMISMDWSNLTQAVWRSPLLPRRTPEDNEADDESRPSAGTGQRFKHDFLNYLRAYGPSKTGSLVDTLRTYDFRSIRAALIGSVPIRQSTSSSKQSRDTLWGWQGLRDILKHIPKKPMSGHKRPVIVAQVSSIATLDTTGTWLENLLQSMAPRNGLGSQHSKPRYRIVFPTPDEIRRSIGGYHSGASIHTPENTKPGQQKQLDYLRPKMVHWAGNKLDVVPNTTDTIRDAGRRRAAPHIKTYVCYDEHMESIDWAMMTSANISKQAWGELPNKNGEVRIHSWELGVIVWPQLFSGSDSDTCSMIPVFKTDKPVANQSVGTPGSTIVGFRMPYDLPLVPYEEDEELWCNKVRHDVPDWMGNSWP